MRGIVAFGRRFTSPSRAPAFSPFSTSSSSGGRGRGRGGPTPFDYVDRRTTPGDSTSKLEYPPSGVGRGHGSAFPTAPSNPTFSPSGAGFGVGRGRVVPEGSSTNEPRDPNVPASVLGGAGRGKVEGGAGRGKLEGPAWKEENRHTQTSPHPSPSLNVPASTLSPGSLGGAGRGKIIMKESQGLPKEENRHARTRPSPSLSSGPGPSRTPTPSTGAQSKLSRDEAVKRARSILSSGEGARMESEGRAWGGRGKGKRQGQGRSGERGEWRGDRDEEEGGESILGVGMRPEDINAAIKELERDIGEEELDEISNSVLPSLLDDKLVDAMDTNFLIELEPEYLMADFASNPDVDDKPPMPLPQVLDKVKPFMMAYHGIQNEEEWKEAVEETMKDVPLLKNIVDDYSGPDTLTAKQQQQELERVAKTIPPTAPASVHRFANRALLSLQSNPGWGFDKKCQFMDKLVREVSER